MSDDKQLSLDDVKRLAKDDPAALAKATRDGRVRDVLSGAVCPTCGTPSDGR